MPNSPSASVNEQSALLADLDEQSRRRARRDLFSFALHISPPSYQFNWHHELLYRKLNEVVQGRCKRLIIEMPPGHGKSEATSRNLPAFAFGLNQDTRIIACSYSLDLAAEMNRDVQQIMDSEEYGRVFPATKLGTSNIRTVSGSPRRNSDIFDIPNGKGFYKAAGIGVGIGGRRFDLGLIDDPIKDRETANSPTLREAAWRWYTSTFCTRQFKNSAIVITSTRWHEDDLIGRIKARIATGDSEPYEILTLPAIATDIRHPEDPRQPGEALWPWLRPIAELEQMRRLEPRDFAALQQQEPRGEGATEWPSDLFGPDIWFDEWPRDLNLRVMSLDPSKGKNAKHGDYSAHVMLARCNEGYLWVQADLRREPTTQIVATGLALAEQFQRETGGILDGFGIEANAFQELLANAYIAQSRAKGIQLPIFKINNQTNKIIRIRRLTSELTSRNIRFRNTPGTRLLVKQLQEFPLCDHDDGPDALEMARRLGIKLQKP